MSAGISTTSSGFVIPGKGMSVTCEGEVGGTMFANTLGGAAVVSTTACGKITGSRGSRERKMTAKGLQWSIEQKLQNFRTSISAWRRHARIMNKMMRESVDTEVLKKNVNLLRVL